MFLENVRRDGQSYALSVYHGNREPEVLRYETQGSVYHENCVPEVLRYEMQDSVVDERGAETAEAIESCPVSRSGKGKRILTRLYNGENTEIANGLAGELSKRWRICLAGRNAGGESSILSGLEDNYLMKHEIGHDGDVHDVPSERRKICLVRKKANKELKGPNSGGASRRSGSQGIQLAENDFNHVDGDDEYTRFLNSDEGGLGSEGKFFDQCVSNHEDDLDEEYSRFLNSGLTRTSEGSYAGLGSEEKFLDQHQSDHEYEMCDKDENECTCLHSVECQTHYEDKIDFSDEDRFVNFVRGGTKGQSNTRPRSECSHLVKCQCDHGDLSDDIDKEDVAFVNQLEVDVKDAMYKIDYSPRRFDKEDLSDNIEEEYVAFLNQLETDGEDAVYRADDSPGRLFKVEESDSDVEIMDKDPLSGGAITPFESSKCINMEVIDFDNYSFAEDRSISCSQFKKGLMEVLKMPYDSKEHEALMVEVSRRRPMVRETVEGDTKKSYRVEHKLGKSHLDLYSDFAKLLRQAKNDDLKSFNLLRGYFYWLKHISEVEGFKPWLDPSCLEVLPQKLTGRTEHAPNSSASKSSEGS